MHKYVGLMDMYLCAPQQFPDQIVGFVPRKHVVTAGGTYTYGSFELQDPEIGGGDR
jgi:alpha-1,4-N-acetylglucosaminyltransferase EXTL2